MKKLIKYIGAFLTAALMFSVTSCNKIIEDDPTNVGLGIKVFFPTKVVAGQPMTINGSGFFDASEIVFPNNVVVTDFEIVSKDMIRVTAPSGIAAEGGKIIVRTSTDEAESRLPLTIGHTAISGYSKQDGESISGGEQLTIYGEDLEFISGVELLDADGNPQVIADEGFYRKGTSSVVFTIPKKNIFDGTFIGKVFTFDGQVFEMPELTYSPSSGGGHWETVKTTIWKGDGSAGTVSWSGQYRFAPEFNLSGEEIASIPQDVWAKMKTETFYVDIEAADPQIRVTTGWWSTMLTADDIFPGNELLTDNGDGTFTLAVNLAGTDLANVIDTEHLLFTGDRYVVKELYFSEEVWIEGEGHWEWVKTPVWKGDSSAGAVSWSGQYRFGLDGHDGNNECIATIPQELWDKMKTETFYVDLEATDPQIRVTTGWWSTTWTGNDIFPGNELLTDNGDGTFTLTVNLSGDPIVDLLDDQHLLFTGDRFTPTEIYFAEEVWVEGGGGGDDKKEVVFWENDGTHGEISWGGEYRFGLEGNDGQNECIATFPADVWKVIKGGTFYLEAKGSNWVQMRITDGWWSTTWTGNDITTGDPRIEDIGDGKYRIAINFEGDPLLNVLDSQHLLFTGGGYTPLRLYYIP